MVASVPYSVTFASGYKENYNVAEAWIANKFVFLDVYVAVLYNLNFTMRGSSTEQVWPPLAYENARKFREKWLIGFALFAKEDSAGALYPSYKQFKKKISNRKATIYYTVIRWTTK